MATGCDGEGRLRPFMAPLLAQAFTPGLCTSTLWQETRSRETSNGSSHGSEKARKRASAAMCRSRHRPPT